MKKDNLHSTMLLLYRQANGHAHGKGHAFTFHYASTLSDRRPADIIVKTHLHSTMLLLYLADNAELHQVLRFTFHYASTLSGYSDEEMVYDTIYIPLCFYFIRYGLTPCSRSSSNLHSTMLLLYQKANMDEYALKENLHSTMLLLYPF